MLKKSLNVYFFFYNTLILSRYEHHLITFDHFNLLGLGLHLIK